VYGLMVILRAYLAVQLLYFATPALSTLRYDHFIYLSLYLSNCRGMNVHPKTSPSFT